MRVEGALLWEVDGEPRRDEVLISDEGPEAGQSRAIVFYRDGRRRASSPTDLPAGSVLLVPETTTDADLGRLRMSGYTARRSAVFVLGRDIPPSELVRASAHATPFVLIKGKGALNLVAELGGPEATAEWLAALAAEVDHPVAINLLVAGGTRTFIVAPPLWPEEKLKGWAAGYMDELQAVLGEARVVSSGGMSEPAEASDSVDVRSQSRDDLVAEAEVELAEVSDRLAARLREARPDLFDEGGRLRHDEYEREVTRRFGSNQTLKRSHFLGIGRDT